MVQCGGGVGQEDEERGRRGDPLHFPAFLTGLNCWGFPHFFFFFLMKPNTAYQGKRGQMCPWGCLLCVFFAFFLTFATNNLAPKNGHFLATVK